MCQALGYSDDPDKVIGHFRCCPGQGLAVPEHTASVMTCVLRARLGSKGVVELSEGMSWDMMILCPSKSVLGQKSLRLASLLCACGLSRHCVGQLAL